MEYVPLWTDIIDGRDGPCWKILDLPPEVYRFWTLCMLAAQKYDYVNGILPDERTLSAWLQMPRDTIVTLRDMAVTCHVLDDLGGGSYKVHDWEHWRDVKDKGATRRKREQRKREKGLTNIQEPVSRDGHDDVTAESRDSHTPTLNSQLSTLNTHTEAPARRSPDDQSQFDQAIEMLRRSLQTEPVAMELSRNAELDRVLALEGWRWLNAAIVMSSGGAKFSYPVLRGIAKNSTEIEFAKNLHKPSSNGNGKPALTKDPVEISPEEQARCDAECARQYEAYQEQKRAKRNT